MVVANGRLSPLSLGTLLDSRDNCFAIVRLARAYIQSDAVGFTAAAAAYFVHEQPVGHWVKSERESE